MGATQEDPWPEGPDHPTWGSVAITDRLLGTDRRYGGVPLPVRWARLSAARLHAMRRDLHESYVGLDDIIDWLLATLIARENALLLGQPGVAKSELATRMFQMLGLTQGRARPDLLAAPAKSPDWWQKRVSEEAAEHKYFHYLLTRYTQPDELFGPVEISLLREGLLARVNFGMLTGPGVRAAFLDEVFKASSSILNTLLTLTQERLYFNWGGMVPSDLLAFIGASNELPGGFGSGAFGQGQGQEDFQTLYAFLDRFPIRLEVPLASGTSVGSRGSAGDEGASGESEGSAGGRAEDGEPDAPLEAAGARGWPGGPAPSDLARAARKAIDREARRFTDGVLFPAVQEGEPMPTVNDLLALGRCALQQDARVPSRGGTGGADAGDAGDAGDVPSFSESLFAPSALKRFQAAFFMVAEGLQTHRTDAQSGTLTWTISPRKLKALYKVALAHAIVRDHRFPRSKNAYVAGPGVEDLAVFSLIWDSPAEQRNLKMRLRVLTDIARSHDPGEGV